MSRQRIDLGQAGEKAAAAYLTEKGYRIIARNFSCKTGEIDIIAGDQETYVFIEVKTRQSSRFGAPAEAVTRQKQKQISRTALAFMSLHNLADVPARFDVISVLSDGSEMKISHIVSAFDDAAGS